MKGGVSKSIGQGIGRAGRGITSGKLFRENVKKRKQKERIPASKIPALPKNYKRQAWNFYLEKKKGRKRKISRLERRNKGVRMGKLGFATF